MNHLLARMEDLIPRQKGVRVLVVGDLVADRYVYAEPSRLSREAPVVVTRFEKEQVLPGAAANAARNLCALGAQVSVLGVVGDGETGRLLLAGLAEHGVETSGIVKAPGYRTVTKTRFLVGEQHRTKQQVFRMDREPAATPGEDVQATIRSELAGRLQQVDAVLLSDYGYGVVDEALLRMATEARGRPLLTSDSRYAIAQHAGVDLVTPNIHELEQAVGFVVRTLEDLQRAGDLLLEQLCARSVLVTRGNQGMSLFQRDHERIDLAATGLEQVTDVSGAGDTVIAVNTLAQAAGASPEEAACLSNLAAGVVVTKVGPATCSPEELTCAARRYL